MLKKLLIPLFRATGTQYNSNDSVHTYSHEHFCFYVGQQALENKHQNILAEFPLDDTKYPEKSPSLPAFQAIHAHARIKNAIEFIIFLYCYMQYLNLAKMIVWFLHRQIITIYYYMPAGSFLQI